MSPTLPIIDIGPYLGNTPADIAARQSTSAALHSACLEFGFFYLDLSSFVEPSVPDELTELARAFFALPQEEKDKLSLRNQDNARGSSSTDANTGSRPLNVYKADNHEGLDFYRPVEQPDKSKPLWGENQFPNLPGFRSAYERWVEKMKTLGLIVSWMANGLGMITEEWHELRSQVDDSFWVMRAIGYPPLPNDHDGFSCGAHKDYWLSDVPLDFCYADPTPSALQVFLRTPGVSPLRKGVWINADPIPGTVVCNIGEMWEIWSNGLYKSTLHRVVHRSSNYRVPFFFEPNFDAYVKPLAAAKRIQGDAHNAPEKQPVVYGDFLLAKVGNNFAGGKGKYDD
ncbi:hypothetical protein C8J57DRAFT_1279916 [Mycena rebaudengoi]|nr:hypothetical protein C8J57DRAFT_1279916 [Mycena rebaudengoi]